MSLKIRFSEKLNFSSKNSSKNRVGLDIGSSSLKAVELRLSGADDYELAAYGFEELAPEWVADSVIVSPEPIADAINSIFMNQRIKNDEVVVAVSGHSAIVKKISLHAQNTEDFAETVRWEAEQHLPFDIDDVNFDFQIIGENLATGMVDVLFVAAKKDIIQNYTNVLKLARKTPKILDVNSFALLNAYEYNYEPDSDKTAALLNIGANTMTINLTSGSDFLFTRDISVGGHRYTEFLQKEFNLDYDTAQALKHGEAVGNVSAADMQYVVDAVTEILCMEIQKTFDFFKSTSTVKNIDRMLVSGGAIHTPGLLAALGDNFDIPVEEFDSFKKIHINERLFPMIKKQAADMAIAVGLALRSEEVDIA